MLAPKPTDDLRAALAAVPDHQVGELVNGTLHVAPRPAIPHALAAASIGDDLISPFQKGRGGPGGWWILFEPELHLGDDVLVPDLAGWRRERLPVPPNAPAFTLAPDWVCEVISPSTARFDRTRKVHAYARHGVAHLWLVDPLLRLVEVYRRLDTTWSLVAVVDGDLTDARLEPFDELPLDLTQWWPPQPPPAVAEPPPSAYAA